MEEALVIGGKDQLESIGINEKITGLKGIVKGYYPSGYVQVEINHSTDGFNYTNHFDIPKKWLRIK